MITFMHTNNFLFQISGGTFMLFCIFSVRCSSRNTIIFLTVSKEIQKDNQRKFYFFSEKEHFQIWYSRSSLKKKLQKKFPIFFSYTKIA